MKRIPILIATLALPVPLAAQFDNPQEKIRDLAEEIAGEMQEIDRLLLQTGAAGSAAKAAKAMEQNVRRMDKLLEQTTETQATTVQRIDDLIKEIEKLGGT
jgi:methyl-accepting chemotaxis protein